MGRGVRKREGNSFEARFSVDGKQLTLGIYACPAAAKNAYNEVTLLVRPKATVHEDPSGGPQAH